MFVSGLGDLGKSRFKKLRKVAKRVVKVAATPITIQRKLIPKSIRRAVRPVTRPISRFARKAIRVTAYGPAAPFVVRRQVMKKRAQKIQAKRAKKAMILRDPAYRARRAMLAAQLAAQVAAAREARMRQVEYMEEPQPDRLELEEPQAPVEPQEDGEFETFDSPQYDEEEQFEMEDRSEEVPDQDQFAPSDEVATEEEVEFAEPEESFDSEVSVDESPEDQVLDGFGYDNRIKRKRSSRIARSIRKRERQKQLQIQGLGYSPDSWDASYPDDSFSGLGIAPVLLAAGQQALARYQARIEKKRMKKEMASQASVPMVVESPTMFSGSTPWMIIGGIAVVGLGAWLLMGKKSQAVTA